MLLTLFLLLPTLSHAVTYAGSHVTVTAPPKTCNALDYGALGDGVTDDTRALQKMLTACAPGGTSLLPAGHVFMSLALSLPPSATNTALRIDGALRFINDTSRWASKAGACLTLAGSNVALLGGGRVDGQGAAWWPCAKAGCARPGLVTASSVRSLLIRDLTFVDSPNHNLELYASPQEVVNVTILAPDSAGVPVPSHNTDGIDVHGDPAFIHNCTISVGDDHVAMHANNTLVEDCVFGTGHGTSIGSLGPGTVLHNITVRRCSFRGAAQALRIKADTASSGELRDVAFTDLAMEGCATTLQIQSNYPDKTPSKSTLQITNVTFARISARGAGAAGSLVCSADAPCRGLVLEDVVHVAPLPQQGWACAFGERAAPLPPIQAPLTTLSHSYPATTTHTPPSNSAWAEQRPGDASARQLPAPVNVDAEKSGRYKCCSSFKTPHVPPKIFPAPLGARAKSNPPQPPKTAPPPRAAPLTRPPPPPP